tara:strand:+ start:346 stop:531 length:186 start_codon:yes stop_codon:yes gene_type:complete
MKRDTSADLGLYLVKPEVKPGLACPVPKDAKPTESQKAYYARKYMEMRANSSSSKKKGKNN